MNLEPAIARYYSSSNSLETEAFASSFTPDAVVLDEGSEVQGSEAIVAWLNRTVCEYGFHLEPRELFDRGDRQIVKTHVSGTFPGAPIDLYHVFDLREGRIARLEIVDTLPEAR